MKDRVEIMWHVEVERVRTYDEERDRIRLLRRKGVTGRMM
jgi:ribosomal protein L23